MCPGFPADCLETLEEIAMEGKEEFLTAGGEHYRYIPCLNDDPGGIAALSTLIEQHLAGWPVGSDPAAGEALHAQRVRALQLGAAD